MENRVAEKLAAPARKRRRDRFVDLRAKFPFLLRYVAIGALCFTVLAVGFGYWNSRNNRPFVLRGEEPQLSMNVLSVVENYERRVTLGDKTLMLVRADRETTYDDQRHELDNVLLENYAEGFDSPDRVTAAKAVYTPDAANPENFTIKFTGNVNFETRDRLKASTEQISYDRSQDFAETRSLINFSRENVSGSAIGAKLNIKNKKLELQNQVEINVAPSQNQVKNSLNDFGSSAVKINSTRAAFDQELAEFELEGAVNIVVTPQDSANVPTTIRAEKAVYNKNQEKIDLSGEVEIVTGSNNVNALNAANEKQTTSTSPVFIRAQAAAFEQGNGKVHLIQNASVEQSGELMNGDSITADISKQKKLEKVATRGNAFLRTASGDRTTEVRAAEMLFNFDANQQIKFANASGALKIRSATAENTLELTDADSLRLNFKSSKNRSLLEKLTTAGTTNVALTANNSADYSNVNLRAPDSTEVLFAAQDERSLLRQMTTGGRTVVTMSAPASQANNARATNKKIVADSLKLFWNQTGADLQSAEAVGNAELYITPLGAAPDVDKQTLFANRFDAEFYPNGNLAKTFVANNSAKAIIEPTQPQPERGVKNLTADKLTANFERAAQTIESFAASGSAKFSELDRNGVANSFTYRANDETVRLRGGEPTVWDSRARFKAVEIDSDLRRKISFGRGKVATTYYSQEQTGGATPFAKVSAPVFLVSNQVEFDHASGVAVYNGNARAWQDDNFVRAEKLTLRRDSKSMFGEGKVQSALYNSKQRDSNNKNAVIPVFAASERITYSDQDKQLRYEQNVDIRQGTDRITGGAADVFLNQSNEVNKTVAQTNVVVTQPGRRATGDWAQYTIADETIVLRGNPATVEDAAQGASNGRQITVFLRENRIVGQGGATPTAPGRVRSTHKVTKQ